MQCCGSTSSMTYSPLSHLLASRTASTSMFAPGAGLPSMSTPITPTSYGWPCSTNGLSVFSPTYTDAGWTMNEACAAYDCWLVSVTNASALTEYGNVGDTF